MDEASFKAALVRIDRLERSNRRLRRLHLVVLLGIAAVFVAGASPEKAADQIDARMLTLRDKEGKVRGTLGIDQNGIVGLEMLDDSGKARIQFGVHEARSGLVLSDKAGIEKVAINVDEAGAGLVEVRGSKAHGLIQLAEYDGTMSVSAFSHGDRNAFELSADPNGNARLSFYDAKKTRCGIGVTGSGDACMLMSYANGKAGILQTVHSDDIAETLYCDPYGHTRSYIRQHGEESWLGFLDQKGQQRAFFGITDGEPPALGFRDARGKNTFVIQPFEWSPRPLNVSVRSPARRQREN